ncbi:MAG: permease-like cell division protein FtsX [Steroidobacteraceae bacterium]
MTAWLSRHLQTLVGSLGRLSQQPVASLLTVLVMGIALALPACLNVLMKNAQEASGSWDRALDVSVYLKTSVTTDTAVRLVEKLQQRSDIKAVQLIKAEDALKEFREHSGFGEALEALSDNPLPNTLVITPADTAAAPDTLNALSEELRKLSEVDVVQLDTDWVQRYLAILDTVRRMVNLVAILLAVGVVVIVGNTIRLDIQNRRDEIEVTKLVGGSDAFVRRPFLYCGFWYGLGGGLLAWVVVAIAVILLAGPVQRIAGLYGSQFRLAGLGFTDGMRLLAVGVTLGWLGSYFAATRHLRVIEPK